MKFYNEVPKKDGLYWSLFKEFDSYLFKLRNPNPYFGNFSNAVQIIIKETIKNKSYFFCAHTHSPVEPDMFYFGDQINKPDSIEIMESWSES